MDTDLKTVTTGSDAMKGTEERDRQSEQALENSLYNMGDAEFQSYMLDGVSRTFALTIPQLPDGLRKVVANAYLLCRTIDTIEDEPAISYPKKRYYCEEFTKVLKGNKDPESFARSLMPQLSDSTLDMERELIQNTKKVIEISHSFPDADQKALLRCVSIMGEGMAFFQENATLKGLKDLEAMDKYCYYVAGVVGEMLTELFCNYNPEIAENKEKMMELAVSFGQGLQMTNILKDTWDDYERGACWLPREVFEYYDFDIDNLENGPESEQFQKGVKYLVGVANHHLYHAFEYTLLIPSYETGIRRFCLWAIGMAVMTLRKIKNRLNFEDSDQVKISRNTVKAVVASCNATANHDFLLKTLFKSIQIGLPLNNSKK